MHGKDMTKLKKVLVVDASKVVRASLVKYLRENFDVCEESNGESAWQSIVLDSSIVAILSGLDINKLEGADLIERIRASKLVRLNRLPFYLLASNNFSEDEKSLARKLGVSDFVPKATAEQAIRDLFGKLNRPDSVDQEHSASFDPLTETQIGLTQAEFGKQTDIGISDFMSRMGHVDGLSDAGQASSPFIPVVADDRRQPLPASSVHTPVTPNNGNPVGVVVFGLDGYKDFVNNYGQEIADKVVMKFSKLLSGKIRGEERIVDLSDGNIAIISPTANRDQCSNFAGRICKALAKAHISIRGQRIDTTVSVGVAAIPERTGETTMNELLRLAVKRLEEAMNLGGNQAIFGSDCAAGGISQTEFFDQLALLLAKVEPGTTMSCKAWMNHVCATCRKAREAGEPAPCICDPTGGHCARCAGTGC